MYLYAGFVTGGDIGHASRGEGQVIFGGVRHRYRGRNVGLDLCFRMGRAEAHQVRLADVARLTGLGDESLDLRRYELPSWPPRSSQGVANDEAAEIWFEEHDPEGVAFEYDVTGGIAS
jgi:hypothetical protein